MRDSDLDVTAKCLAHTLSTYVSARSLSAYPSVGLLASGASVSRRTAGLAIARLEEAGFIDVSRSLGRSSHTYTLTLPNRAANDQLTAQLTTLNRSVDDANRAAAAHKSAESAESVSLRAHARAGKKKGRRLAALPEDHIYDGDNQ